jgi:hypothetical protein
MPLPIFPIPDIDWKPNTVSLCVFNSKTDELIDKQDVSLIWGALFGPDLTNVTQLGIRCYINWWIKDRAQGFTVNKFDAFWGKSDKVMVTLNIELNSTQLLLWKKNRESDLNLSDFTLNPDVGDDVHSVKYFVPGYRAIEANSSGEFLSSYTLEKSTSHKVAIKGLEEKGYSYVEGGRHGTFVGIEFKKGDGSFFISDPTMVPMDSDATILLTDYITEAEERDMLNISFWDS